MSQVVPIKQNFNKLGSTSDHCFSLECAPLDIPLGFGGYRSGKIYEIRGPESRGKSTLALEFVFAFGRYWNALNQEYRVKWIETESAFDATRTIWMQPEIGTKIEVDEAETVEQAHSIAKDFMNECYATNVKPIVIWDTLAAAKTDAQLLKNDQYGGGQQEAARYLRWMFRDITQLLGKTGCPLILPNQTWTGEKPKNPKARTPQHSYGGGAMKYHPSVRLDIQPHTKPMMEIAENGSENNIGIITNNEILKNKITGIKLPFQLYINNENGLDKIATTIGFLQDRKIARIEGSWKKLADWTGKDMTWQSQKQIATKMAEDETIKQWMDYKVYEWYARSSPLVKLRTIDKVWEFEKKFFDKQVTELTEKEVYVGKKLEEHAIKEQERQDEKEVTETKKKKASKKVSKKSSDDVEFV